MSASGGGSCWNGAFQARWSRRGRSGVLKERYRFGRGAQDEWLYQEALA
ncbi:hypothetical protein [Cyanobium sp. ATX 6F1]|nr:hypothetical protein [Cyanobium sp. ATX 6F1]